MDTKKQDEAPDPSMVGFPGSTNEPKVDTPAAPADHPIEDGDYSEGDLPPKSALEDMTRAELDDLAEKRGVATSGASNKADVIDALKKDERKRKRNEGR